MCCSAMLSARCYWLFSTEARMKRVSITAVNSDGDQVVGMNEATAHIVAALGLSTHTNTCTEDVNVCMKAYMQRHLQMLTHKKESLFFF